MKATTLEWIKKSEQDFSDAHAKGISVDLVCFLCQQCVEKYLKAYLEESDIPFPKIHDLDTLLNLVIPLQPLWESWRFGFKRLTRYAAEFRYPGEWANEKDATTSLRIATDFRKEIRLVFGSG
jgi:HEPN domain-containing protein